MPATTGLCGSPPPPPRAGPGTPHHRQALLAIPEHTHPLDGLGPSGLGSQTWDEDCAETKPIHKEIARQSGHGMRLGPCTRHWGLSLWGTAGVRSRI